MRRIAYPRTTLKTVIQPVIITLFLQVIWIPYAQHMSAVTYIARIIPATVFTSDSMKEPTLDWRGLTIPASCELHTRVTTLRATQASGFS